VDGGDGGGEGGDGGEGDPPPPQDGVALEESNVPVHTAQFDADRWHQPVPSSPQSPQLPPNLQQPAFVGGGGGGGGVGVGAEVVGAEVGVGDGEGGEGPEPPSTLKSTQEMKVSGGTEQTLLGKGIREFSAWENLVVLRPTLLASLQVFPVFQIQRPTASPVGHEKEAGTEYIAPTVPLPGRLRVAQA